MAQVIIGLLIIGMGFLIVWKSDWLYQNLGPNAWAERHLGTSGGTRLLYKLLGLGGILVGTLVMTGLIEGILMFILNKFFMR